MGENSANFHRQCHAMINIHRSALLVLLKTKMIEQKTLSKALGFDFYSQLSVVGLSGGIAMMWKEYLLHLDNFTSSPQGILIMIKVRPDNPPWIFLPIYASPNYHTHTVL